MFEHRSEVVDVPRLYKLQCVDRLDKNPLCVRCSRGIFAPVMSIEKEKFSLSRSLSEKIAKHAPYASPEPDDELPVRFEVPGTTQFRAGVVDVGGGDGSLLAKILAHCPSISGTYSISRMSCARLPTFFREAHVDQRCTIVGGSFFDEVLTGADAYILKFILHDWNDDQGLRILRNLPPGDVNESSAPNRRALDRATQ